ncbi:hypothetical protein NL676_020209 [Syzygium grande]|nr:hypothetical protein NL676_020209 [Syzygium grande]
MSRSVELILQVHPRCPLLRRKGWAVFTNAVPRRSRPTDFDSFEAEIISYETGGKVFHDEMWRHMEAAKNGGTRGSQINLPLVSASAHALLTRDSLAEFTFAGYLRSLIPPKPSSSSSHRPFRRCCYSEEPVEECEVQAGNGGGSDGEGGDAGRSEH